MTRVIGAAPLGLICQESFLWDVSVKTYPPPLKDALGGLVVQVRFERFSFNELQSSEHGHSFRTCIVLALQC